MKKKLACLRSSPTPVAPLPAVPLEAPGHPFEPENTLGNRQSPRHSVGYSVVAAGHSVGYSVVAGE